jgi:integrase/recombinase XerD
MWMHKEKQPIRLCMALMLYCGIRLSETVATCWADITHLGEPKSALVIDKDMSKTGRLRTIPIGPVLAEEIRAAWIHWAQPKRLQLIHSIAARTALGNPISNRQIERRVEHIGKVALSRRLTPHMLRHTFATRLLKVTNIRAVQDMLGHQKLTTTQIYTHPDQEQLRQAIIDLDPGPTPAKLDHDNAQAVKNG